MQLLIYYIKLLLKLPEFIFYFLIDLVIYIKNKGWKEFYGWGLHLYLGPFGSGKTSTMVAHAYALAKRYPQLSILTNLKLANFPEHTNILPLRCGKDILNAPPNTLVLVDEIGTIFNSRDFAKSKESVPKVLFQHLCQCRKRKLMIYATTQRWGFMDKQLRDITATVRYCGAHVRHPFSRLMTVKYFDAYEYDLAYTNPLLPLRLLASDVYIQTNKHRNLYSTVEMVDNMLKMEYIDDAEILANRGVDMDMAEIGKSKRNYNRNKAVR